MLKPKIAITIGFVIPAIACVGLFIVILGNSSSSTNVNAQIQELEQTGDVIESSAPSGQSLKQDQVNIKSLPTGLEPCFGLLLQSHRVVDHRLFGSNIVGVVMEGIKGLPRQVFNAFTLVDGKCEDLNLSMGQWAGKVDPVIAVEMKEFWWSAFSQYKPEEFQKMITVPAEVAIPFFPEDKEAIAALGHELKVRVFQDDDEYFLYSYENDPYILKNHPNVQKRLKEIQGRTE